ncbi:unnamed protein product [Discosporangium mesarthrocarpum]
MLRHLMVWATCTSPLLGTQCLLQPSGFTFVPLWKMSSMLGHTQLTGGCSKIPSPDLPSSPSSSTNPFEGFSYGSSFGNVKATPSPKRRDRVSPNKREKKPKTLAGNRSERVKPNQAKGLPEKYRSPGEPEWPLRLIIVGHNPSERAWEEGHYYANPSNRMWKLLSAAGIIPEGFKAENDGDCPVTCGVGFTDLGFSHPGTDSSSFKKQDLHRWRHGFYRRLEAHAKRAAVVAASNVCVNRATTGCPEDGNPKTRSGVTAHGDIGLGAGAKSEPGSESRVPSSAAAEGSPKVVAFSGKRQWEELFFDADKAARAAIKGGKGGSFSFGLQPPLRPPDWPFPAESTDVFVLTSSSGAAAMTNEAREAPYMELGRHLLQWEWKRKRIGDLEKEEKESTAWCL